MKILVTEPGKGREVMPNATGNALLHGYKEAFEASHPIRPAIDKNGHDLAPRSEAYECVQRYQYYSNAGVWITSEYSEDFYLTVQGYETREVYQTIEAAVKEENLPKSVYKKERTLDEIIFDILGVDESFSLQQAFKTINIMEIRKIAQLYAAEVIKRNQPPKAVSKEGRSAEQILLEHASPASMFRNGKDLNYLVLKEDAIKAINAVQHAQEGKVDVLSLLEDRIADYISENSEQDKDFNDGLRVALDEIHKLKTAK